MSDDEGVLPLRLWYRFAFFGGGRRGGGGLGPAMDTIMLRFAAPFRRGLALPSRAATTLYCSWT